MSADRYRIPNGAMVLFPEEEWEGMVIDQSGPDVMVTMRGGHFGTIQRSHIVKEDGRWTCHGRWAR